MGEISMIAGREEVCIERLAGAIRGEMRRGTS